MRYEYGTSPRKYDEYYYRRPTQKKSSNKSMPKKAIKKKSIVVQNNAKTQNKTVFKPKTIFALCIIFSLAISISSLSSRIEKNDMKISQEKNSIEQIKNENSKLDSQLQRAFSITNLEKQAKEKLGMQKLSKDQIRYVKINKEDYIEPVLSTVVQEKEKNIFEKIFDLLKGK